MEKDLRRLMRDPSLLAPEKRELLANVAAQAALMEMPCYAVGGFTRDLLLGKPVNDLDVIVEGDAIKLGKALVQKYGGKLIPHYQFVTAVWKISAALDLITARRETYAYPGALPVITPSSIKDDIRRRDFTINAMATRLDAGHFGGLFDPLGGRADLAEGVIRVLHPRSFMDDPTRIFRAARYEQRYGFQIESATLKLINAAALETLSTLSGERIRHEFDLILAEENAARILSRLQDFGVLDLFRLPPFSRADLLGHPPAAEFNLPVSRVTLGYLLWLANSSAAEIEFLARRLDFNAELTAALFALAQIKSELPKFKTAKPSAWTFRLEKIPPPAVYALWLLESLAALKDFLVKWRHVKPGITGNDLKARGISPGPEYKEILSRLRAAWLDGEINDATQELELTQKIGGQHAG